MTTITSPSPAPGVRGPRGKKKPPRLLDVLSVTRLTPRMMRVVLGGEALAGFPDDAPGGHIKAFFPRDHQHEPSLPTLTADGPVWPAAEERPITRTYSVRHMDCERQELAIDFVLHGDDGPASRWALSATPGDRLGIAGPGGPLPLLKPASRYVLAGDLTAVPAIAALLEALPEDATGDVFIEAVDPADTLPLAHPESIQVHWLYRETLSAGESPLLINAVKALGITDPEGLFGWAGGENSAVLAIREYMRHQLGMSKKQVYAVPYWKDQFTEERYHEERHRIMDDAL
ncbi:siderophore-interacting protein [Larsenimonas rhizosphaerae]|uniref:Siderophore-interacting protein n=1 Tax=Larsenimonas rhizosphaerae TaxID=2944682 RepID=A0AA41ZNZ5_9GAMM|nr:siderophore-interacting protein [Larsenimonas rhizosphaerae]MCX2524490.1 siderophore-interacting protein [Larsenimonas rhizosphaerae]